MKLISQTVFTVKSLLRIATLLAAIFLSQSAHSQTSSTRSTEKTWRVRGVSSMFKLTATAPGKIEVFPTAPVHLRGARGEWECFQVVVSTDKKLRDVRVESTGFATHLGEFVRRENVQIYRQHFVAVAQPSGNRVLARKLWSDALIPIALQPSIDIEAGQSAAFWVAVRVPDDAEAGDYFSAFEVRAEGEIMRELPIVLSVSKAKMPPPTMRANVAVYYDSLRDWYSQNINSTSDENWNAQQKRYYQFLLDYRLNAYDLPVSWNSDVGR